MDAHSVVDDWETAPFDGGFGGLDELASRGFSGAVEAGGTWLFLRDGEALAVVSELESDPRPGDIDAFEDATGQRYQAPNRPVATLAPMLALDGEVRGQYFTDDTPLDAVDETLTEGGFTGYVELSENVLSGEYYYVYVDGEVEHVGFVGASELLVGEEAERKATGEVGIYAVVAVELPRPELPEPPEPEPDPDDAVGTGAPSDRPDEAGSTPEADPDGSPPGADSPPDTDRAETEQADTPDSTPPSESDSEATDRGATPESNADSTDGDAAPSAESSDDDGDAGSERRPGDRTADAERSPSVDDSASDASSPSDRSTDDEGEGDRTESSADLTPPASAADPADSGQDPGGIEAVTTRTVPSLDPEQSGRADAETEATPTRQPGRERTESSGASSSDGTRPDASQEPSGSTAPDRSEERVEEYESKIETYESRIEELESELADADSRIEELESELESLRAERDDLRERLEAAETATGADDAGDAAGTSLAPIDALSQTSLFVRATSRGDATLADARDGGADRETVAENLRIEYHTEFEDEGATVEGEPFEAWLRSSDTYTFVEWLLTELFFEIRSTDAIEGLAPLYEALPEIDRIGFEETIAVGDGAAGREVEFDIVARNKKGNPVVVVAFDRQRNPTRAEAIEPLVTDASDVCQEHDSLAGAVAITSSYFESDARAAVEEATSTSLLSRSKYRSYVKLSRASGYHLCLAEFRDGSFNLTHPEL